MLIIDLNGQTNLTESFGLSIEEEKTVWSQKGEYGLPFYVIRYIVIGNNRLTCSVLRTKLSNRYYFAD